VIKKGLGRGLEALLPEIEVRDEDKITEVSLDEITANPFQPRKSFDDAKIAELAASIREYGVLQPIILRRHQHGYQLVAGERRYRAAKKADLDTIPAVIRDIEDDRLMEIALIENLQREDLNPVEEAMAYDKLINNLDMTQEQLADRLGKSRSQIANYIRLLNLSDEIISMLSDGKIAVGHAKVLLSVEDKDMQNDLAKRIASEQLSVRQAEEMIQENEKGNGSRRRRKERNIPGELLRVEDALKVKIGAMVKLSYNEGRGKIEIPFSDPEELERILEYLLSEGSAVKPDRENRKGTPFVV
jgi:ParB family transcriptional regulator, chromosome partitioning protein